MPRVPQPLTRSLFLTLLTSVMLPTYGCSAPEIENGAPYLCQVIPKDAVRLVSRPDDEGSAIEEKVLEGNFSGDFYSCIAEKGFPISDTSTGVVNLPVRLAKACSL